MQNFIVYSVLSLLVYTQVVDAKLRNGQTANDVEALTVPHRAYQNRAAFSVASGDETAEQYLRDFLQKLGDELVSALGDTNSDMSVSSRTTALEVPDVSFENYLVLRHRTNPEQCSGPVVKMLAQYVGCVPNSGGSMSIVCLRDNNVRAVGYSNSDCTGSVTMELNQTLPSCLSGGAYQCNPNPNPAFTEKAGLSTFKFLNAKRCNTFANEVLHFDPVMSDDEVNFDDGYRSYAAPDDDDSQSNSGVYDNGNACCIQSELFDNCPYPACTESPAPEGRSRRSDVPVVGLASQALEHPSKRTSATQDMPMRWWQTTADAEQRSLLVTVPTTVRGGTWYREYVLTQLRTGVCAYDETYQIWVKTSCSGEKNTFSYQLFADADCLFPMKRVDHVLTEVFPEYGKCVKSKQGDKRTSLLLCNGKNGVVPPVSAPIEKK